MSAAHGHGNHGTIENPGNYELSGGLKGLFAVCALIGVATFIAGLMVDPTRTWASFVWNHFYFMSLAVGGLFIAAIQWVTGAMWSAPIRRLAESFTAYLPFALVGVVVLYFGLHHLYVWTDPSHVQGDHVMEIKQHYLTTGWFTARNIFAVLVWLFFAKVLIGNSVAQDTSKDARLTLKNKSIVPLFLIFFALTYTLSAFDQMMSLDPHWFSTMFGVYCFAGLFYSSLALTCLLTLHLRKRHKLDGIVNENHLHDIGKFMFAFTVFWAYIGFSQFMLIWYANMPEETLYFLHRMHGSWMYISIFLIAGQFLVPFLLLLPREAKRNEKMLWGVGWFMMIAQWIDVMWMVQPEFFKDGPCFGWIEIGMVIGFVGIFALACFRFLAKHNIVAIGDPKLAESVFHHHQ